MIRLILSDENPEVRAGLASALAGDPEIFVGEAIEDHRHLDDAVRRHAPDVIVLAANSRAVDAVDACEHLRMKHPRIRAIVALSSARQAALMAALAAGARAVVLKDSTPALLRDAVRTVAAGWSFVDPRLTSKLVDAALRGHRRSGIGGLTSQELRVVQRLLLGLDDAEIAAHMGLQEATVRSYVRRAREKLGARDRVEAGAIARREGLV